MMINEYDQGWYISQSAINLWHNHKIIAHWFPLLLEDNKIVDEFLYGCGKTTIQVDGGCGFPLIRVVPANADCCKECLIAFGGEMVDKILDDEQDGKTFLENLIAL